MSSIFSSMKPKKINLADYFKKYRLERVKINLSVVKAEIIFDEADKNAAWDLYVEMLTRIATQPLPSEDGDEKTALTSIYSLFPTTRKILRRHGRNTIHFSKIAIPVLNQIVRPFTAKWHRECLLGTFDSDTKREEFRKDMENLQGQLRNYNHMLADIAGVEDLTELEQSTPELSRKLKRS